MIHCIICGGNPLREELLRVGRSISMQSVTNGYCHYTKEADYGPRNYLVRNTWETILNANPKIDPEDILVFIDMDDFLIDEKAFEIIEDAYAANPTCLLTYGSYVNLSNNKRGKFCGAYDLGESVRHSSWRASHLKTCKMKLWKQLPESVLKWPDGTWFRCAADRAFMIPLMEMAGLDRCVHIDWLLYCYNDLNPESVWSTMRDESIKTREHIERMPELQRMEF